MYIRHAQRVLHSPRHVEDTAILPYYNQGGGTIWTVLEPKWPRAVPYRICCLRVRKPDATAWTCNIMPDVINLLCQLPLLAATVLAVQRRPRVFVDPTLPMPSIPLQLPADEPK